MQRLQFAVGFYDELGTGWSYEDAYHGGCDAITLQAISEEHTPVFKNLKKSPIEGYKSLPTGQYLASTSGVCRH